MKVTVTTRARAYKYIAAWVAAPKMDGIHGKKGAVTLLLVPRKMWLVPEADGRWSAIDNHDGYMTVREFATKQAAKLWLEERSRDDK